MTRASLAPLLLRHRRTIAFCAATGLLHYQALDWVSAHGGRLREAEQRAAPAAAITAQLRLTPSAQLSMSPSAPGLATRPAPSVRERPKREARVLPVPVLEAGPSDPVAPDPLLQSAAQAAAPEAETKVGPEIAPAQPAPEAVAQQAPQSGAPAALDQSDPSGVEASAPAPRSYQVSLPPPAQLALDVVRVNPDGTVWNGEGAMTWRVEASRYQMRVEAGISLLVARVNLLILTSEGIVDQSGIAPVRATEQRKGRAQTATHFNRGAGRITFSASERSYPLLPGAQDKATLPMQLAGIGRADSGQFKQGGAIEVLVGEDKEANTFRFDVLGQEQLETKLGTLQTWHLSRPPKPGAYSSRLDVWLAPGRDWYPVQIRNSEANGAVTTQIVTNITVHDLPGK